MPRYDYRCPSCGAETERTHSISDCGKPQRCDRCSAELERLIANTAGATADKRFRTAAILEDGRKVPGHFGISAPNRGFGMKD